MAGEPDLAALEDDQLAETEGVPAIRAERAGRDHEAVVGRLGLEIDREGLVAEVASLAVPEADLAEVQALPAVDVVVDEQPAAVGEQDVELAEPVRRGQGLVEPSPVATSSRCPPRAAISPRRWQKNRSESVSPRGGRRPIGRSQAGAVERPVVGEAIVPPAQLPGEGVGVGVGRLAAHRLVADVGEVGPAQERGMPPGTRRSGSRPTSGAP